MLFASHAQRPSLSPALPPRRVAAMADDFEKAILFSFALPGAVDEGVRAQAADLLQRVKASPDSLQLLAERFVGSGYAEVKFWCLQALHEAARSGRCGALPAEAQGALKRALLVHGAAPGLPAYLRNKAAQVVVALAAHEYPGTWPAFFQDLLSTLPQGAHSVDFFCRWVWVCEWVEGGGAFV